MHFSIVSDAVTVSRQRISCAGSEVNGHKIPLMRILKKTKSESSIVCSVVRISSRRPEVL